MWINWISGTIIMITTFLMSLYGIMMSKWRITPNFAHNIFGFIVMLCVFQIGLSGFIVKNRMNSL